MIRAATAIQTEPNTALLAGKAFSEIRKSLSRACTFVGAEAPDLGDEAETNRVETPFTAGFTFSFGSSRRVVNGNVDAGNIPVVGHNSVSRLREKLRSELVSLHASDKELLGKVLRAEYKTASLFQTDYAVCKDTCGSCDGVGNYSCSPCGGGGSVRCTRCLFTGRERCVACSGNGGVGNIPCTYCNRRGWNPCFVCKGTVQTECAGCRGRGNCTCGGCNGSGIVSTVYHADFSVSGELSSGPTLLSSANLTALKVWVLAAFPRPMTRDDDPAGNMEVDLASATISRTDGELSYKVAFRCFSTVSRIDFLFEGKRARVEYTKSTFSLPKVTFSNFLDHRFAAAAAIASDFDTPSGVRKALKEGGYPKIAECMEKPDDYDFRIEMETNGAVSRKSAKALEDHYWKVTETFARGALRRAWKLPVVLTLGAWWVACLYDIPQRTADMESPLWMVGLAFCASLAALLSSNVEARYAIVSEANSVRGWRAGPAAYVSAVGAAALFWTSCYYGFKI